jgi:excisionase family DNA binding protein
MLGVSRKTLWRIVRSGELPAVYVDRRPRFLAEDVAAFIASRRQAGGGA